MNPPTSRSAAGAGRPSDDEAHVGGRAAHVEGDGVGEAVGRRGRRAPARTPPAGPDSSSAAGSSAASAAGSSPPAEVMTSTSSASVGEAPQVRAAGGAQVGVDHRRDRALVLAELGRHLVRAATRRGPRSRSALGHRLLVAPGRGRRAAGTRPPPRRPGRCRRAPPGSTRRQLRPVGRRAGRRPRSAGGGAPAARAGRRQLVVERRPVLAADLDDVGEALGGHQRDRRAPPLEQRVGGDRGAVGQQSRAPVEAGAADRAADGPRRVVGRRQHLGDRPSAATRSVNVPPVSTPTCTVRSLARRCRIAAALALGAPPPPAGRPGRSWGRRCGPSPSGRSTSPRAGTQLDQRLPQVAVGDRLALA